MTGFFKSLSLLIAFVINGRNALIAMEGLITNLDLFLKLKESGSIKNTDLLCGLIKSKLTRQLSDDQSKDLKSFCAKYCYNLQKRWVKSGSKSPDFLKNNSNWLDLNILWPKFMEPSSVNELNLGVTAGTSSQEDSLQTKSVGISTQFRPRKPFTDLGLKQKKRRTENIATTVSFEEQSFIYLSSLKANGYNDIAEILNYLLKNPQEVERVKDSIFSHRKEVMPSEKALGMMLSLKLTKWQYTTLRKTTQEDGVALLPSYYSVQKVKEECYPPREDIEITDMSVKIKLQSLLDVTTERLLKFIEIDDEQRNLQLFSKWGFDGSSNQSNYKQTGDRNEDDSSIFMGSLVPIKLVSDEHVLWENETPNSTYFCRPIFFKFVKESRFHITNEMNQIESEINSLNETVIRGKTVSHKLLLTMIDGKVTSALSDTSAQCCDICKAKPKEMNDLDLLSKKEINSEIYRFGISSLHAWIRFMECILHISYRLEFKTWAAKDENKVKMERKKREIQEAFKNRTGLLIDIVKQGHGSTNDGNTARRFFANVSTTASITGVDENLIRRFSVLLETISSGLPINTDKFKEFADETILLYNQLYHWYYMPASVHKILVHGKDIIANFGLIPIGKLSEEAAESRNKDFRRFRELHSRKFSRKATNEDILNNFLVTSDPYISTKRPKLRRKHKYLSKATRNLLIDGDEEKDPEKENLDFVDVNLMSDIESDD